MYLSKKHREVTERVLDLRHKNGKGVTATVATALLMSMAVAGAGTYYAVQSGLMEEAKEDVDFEALESTPIKIESCWTNRTSTYLSIRNQADTKALLTDSMKLYVEGQKVGSKPNKQEVAPQRTFILESDRFLKNGITPRIENKEYYATKFCGQMAPALEADFNYTPVTITTADTVDFGETAEGIITDYKWEKDGAQIGTGEDIEHQFTNSGDVDVSLRIEDVLNNTDVETKTIDVKDIRFLINSQSNNGPITEGETFQLDYVVENYGTGEGTQEIKLNIDGNLVDSENLELDSGESSSGTLEWSTVAGDAGTHSFEISTENDNQTGNLEVNPVLPVSNADHSPNYPETDTTITLDGSGSNYNVQGGSITSYQWTVTDSSGNVEDTGNGQTYDITGGYSTEDTYEAELQITTNTGRTDTDTDQIQVSDKTLIADFNYNPSNPNDKESVSFSDDSTVEDTTVTSYNWDFNDGSSTATGSSASHQFSSSGSYNVELTITDNEGDTSTETKSITVISCDSYFAGGSGNDSDPYEISNVDELQNVQECPGLTYEVTQNIDASSTSSWNGGSGFNPIGGFDGEIRGNNNEVTNLYIDRSTNKVGLLSHMKGGKIQNIDIINADITNRDGSDSAIRAGVVAGEMSSGATIENISASGEVTYTSGSSSSQIGGFIAFIKGNVVNSEADVTVESNGARAGGFAATISDNEVRESVARGDVNGGGNAGGFVGLLAGEVYDSEAYGNVDGSNSIGGFVGSNSAANSGSYIENSEAHGNVEGTDSVGGFAGSAGSSIGTLGSSRDISGSEAYGDVNGDKKVGGFVGDFIADDNTIDNSHAEGSVNGNSKVGGFAGQVGRDYMDSNEHLKILSSSWDSSKTGLTNGTGIVKEGSGQVTVELSDTS